MTTPDTFWLTATNVVLGVVVVLCFVVLACQCICGFILQHRKERRFEAELNRDMKEMFGVTHGLEEAPAVKRRSAAVSLQIRPLLRFLETTCQRWCHQLWRH